MENANFTGSDGFLHCAACGDVIEREIDMPLFNGSGETKKMLVHCMCRCQKKEKEEREQRMKFEEEKRIVSGLRQMSLMDARLKDVCFSCYQITDENRRAFGIARRYVENFGEMFGKGQGLLLWGNVGTGKSYTAAAIANELLRQRQSVVMTSFIKLIDEVSGLDGNDGNYIFRLNQAKLLIIDDLGAERGTDFALEKVYDIIDSRYRSRKPLILTTNLEISQMKSCADIRYSRIYDRIFEMCYPIKLDGLSWRKKDAAERFAETKKILEG